MNTVAEKPVTESSSLALITLDPARYVAEVYAPFRAKFNAAKVEADAIVIDCSTTAGKAIAIKYRAIFRDDVRLAIECARTERKAPILTIGRLIDSGAKEITAEAAPYEARFDNAIKAQAEKEETEKQAKIAADRARVEAIHVRINAIRDLPLQTSGQSSEEIGCMIGRLAGAEPDESFAEFLPVAITARHAALEKLAQAQTVQRNIEVEAESRRQEAARAALAAEAERAELAALRAAAAKVAAEQAVEAKRLADLAAAQEAEAKRQREQAAAEQAERERVAAEAQAKANAELKAAQDKLAADVAAHEAEVRREADHADALAMNGARDAAALAIAHSEALAINAAGHYFSETVMRDDGKPIMLNPNGSRSIFCDLDEGPDGDADDLARCAATVSECLADGRNTQTRQVYPLSILGDLTDAADGPSDLEPSAWEIIDLYQREFGATQAQAIARLGSIDWAAVAREFAA